MAKGNVLSGTNIQPSAKHLWKCESKTRKQLFKTSATEAWWLITAGTYTPGGRSSHQKSRTLPFKPEAWDRSWWGQCVNSKTWKLSDPPLEKNWLLKHSSRLQANPDSIDNIQRVKSLIPQHLRWRRSRMSFKGDFFSKPKKQIEIPWTQQQSGQRSNMCDTLYKGTQVKRSKGPLKNMIRLYKKLNSLKCYIL